MRLSWVVVVHAFNPNYQKAEAGRSLGVQIQPGLQDLVPGKAPKLQRNPVLKNQKEGVKLSAVINFLDLGPKGHLPEGMP